MAGRVVMLFRRAMLPDVDLMPGAWAGARMFWSQWEGYLTSPANEEFREKLAARAVTLEPIHTWGHASIMDLKRLVEALAPDALVPVHTFEGDRYGRCLVRTCAVGWMVNGGKFDALSWSAGMPS